MSLSALSHAYNNNNNICMYGLLIPNDKVASLPDACRKKKEHTPLRLST
jgi:hypothetical protein